MGWIDYYNILKEHDSFDQAPKEQMKAAADANPNTPQDARRLAQQKFDEEIAADKTLMLSHFRTYNGNLRSAPVEVRRALMVANHLGVDQAFDEYSMEKYGCKTVAQPQEMACPQCNFPVTQQIKDASTKEVVAENCAKGCGWEKILIEKKPQ